MPIAKRDDWRTPQAFFDALHAGPSFAFDAAASKIDAVLPKFLDGAR